ncbi:hypothetical protein BJY01DRAFT_233064 [Aspergillus pseudoustus]|uniref:TauD/TfdA-like domain-containing protein n=1 Tax=Aspergillus pseudoustus TaxID=1810923 RepID=A0ABR4KFD9_9EURO
MTETQTLTNDSAPKWWSCTAPNLDYVPPKDFKLPPTLVPVTLNPRGTTEVPQKTTKDYTKVEYKWKHFLPYNTATADPPLTPFDHVDPSSRADPTKASLFEVLKNRKDMTPNIGTEVTGAQLSQLNSMQRDELALYVAERGVIVFRKQDFTHHSPEWLKEFGTHFGRLHVHQFGTHVQDHSELSTLFRDNDDSYFDVTTSGRLNTLGWHSDMTYEINPPGTTFLCALTTPDCGGDTLYLNAMTAYDRLSEPMKKLIEGLSAVHEGTRQTVTAYKTNIVRREALDTVHPMVRTHPVTGRKALWVNPVYTTQIVGLKKEESDGILKILFDHIKTGLDFHTRVKWEDDTVAVYDNRMVMHSVVLDYPLGTTGRRHMLRVTPQGEKPAL